MLPAPQRALVPRARNTALRQFMRAPPRGARLAGAGMGGLALAQIARRGVRSLMSYASGAGSGPKPAGTRVYRATAKRRVVTKPKTKGQKLAKQVKNLQRQVNANTSTLRYKARSFGTVKALANQAAYSQFPLSTTSLETVLQNLRYFDPAAPGTYKTVDFTSGTQSKSVETQFFSKLDVRNNYKVPVIVDIYCCTTKQDTNIDTVSAVTQGLTDLGISNPSTEVQCFPTESPQFQDLWKVEKHTQIELQPNLSTSLSWSCRPFSYDPSVVDSHALTYQKEMRSMAWLVRVMGVTSHDSAQTSEVGQTPCGVDVMNNRIFTIKYPGGADFEYVIVTNGGTGFTNGANVSMPTVTQVQYGL